MRLGRILQLLQPAHPQHGHRKATVQNQHQRRQRLQALCGQWQAAQLERQCGRLLPTSAAASAASNASCCQGALLFALAWLQAIVADVVLPEPCNPVAALHDADTVAARRAGLEQLLMTLMTLLEPYPFARQQRVTNARDLHGEPWRLSCTPLLQQLLRASHACHCLDADAALATHGGVLQRLRAAHEHQLRREAEALDHGTPTARLRSDRLPASLRPPRQTPAHP